MSRIGNRKLIVPTGVTVTVNDDFVERDDFETTKLNEGDAVEFLYFMGGGAY